MPDDLRPRRSTAWLWGIYALLLLATMLNYMDRQTLSLTITTISREVGLSEANYGTIEFVFGIAFAAGGLVLGALADRVSVRLMYPVVLIGWSLAGISTAWAGEIGAQLLSLAGDWLPAQEGSSESTRAMYVGLLVCRGVLGFFEAGQWPCALITTQRLLSQADRAFGNSLLQSGASIGAITTPLVIQLMVTDAAGSWRSPFVVIGLLGMTWVIPWLILIRRSDLEIRGDAVPTSDARSATTAPPTVSAIDQFRKLAALVVIVIAINLTWQYFRAWLPMFLEKFHKYERTHVNLFTSAYYIATDLGCISAGVLSRVLVHRRGWSVHGARLGTFALFALLTSLSTVAATLPRGPLLLGLMLVIGYGSLGLFPMYYSLTQDISFKHQGKVTGALGATTWVVTAIMQQKVGEIVTATQSYATAIFAAGLAPLLGLAALALIWPRPKAAAADVVGERA